MKLAFGVLALILAASAADEWPGFRGPNRDGFVPSAAASLPSNWPAQLQPLWAIEVGEGYSSPVVSGDLVCVHARKADEENVTCASRASGKVLWTDKYASPFAKNPYATKMSSGPFASPLLTRGTLYTFGVNAVLTAYDAASGKIKWRRQPEKQPVTKNMFCGSSASPLLDQGRLIIYWGDDFGGSINALDPVTGKTIWSWTGDGPGYASPIAADIGGTRQYITLSDKSVVGIEAAAGKLLWKSPFKDEWNENIVTPVVSAGLLIVSGTRHGLTGLKVARNAKNEWSAEPMWHTNDIAFYMSTPLAENGVLYGLSNKKKGQFVAVDAATGKLKWSAEGRAANQAAIVAAGSNLFALTDDGSLIVASRDPAAFKQIARYDLAPSATYAHPVLAGKQLLIKDQTHLRAFRLP